MAPRPKASSAVPIVIIAVVVVFGGIFVLGIIAAIAIPGLLRARIGGNEASAIATVRTMVSAQATWASAHAGRFTHPSCLGEPAGCGDTQATAPYLPAEIASLQPRSGYVYDFVLRPSPDDAPGDAGAGGSSAPVSEEVPGVSQPGAPTDAEVRAQIEQFSTPDAGGAAATSLPAPRPTGAIDPGGFAYWASPTTPGSSGTRRFCADQTGLVLEYDVDAPWTPPAADQARCPEGGRPIG
jgi:hypothetical protein